MTALYYLTQGVEFHLFAATVLAYVLAWPVAPALVTVLGQRRLGTVAFTVAYLLAGSVFVLFGSVVARYVLGHSEAEPLTNLLLYVKLVLSVAAPPFCMLSLLVAGRRMRLVSPLLLCGLLLFGAGALFGEGAFVRGSS